MPPYKGIRTGNYAIPVPTLHLLWLSSVERCPEDPVPQEKQGIDLRKTSVPAYGLRPKLDPRGPQDATLVEFLVAR